MSWMQFSARLAARPVELETEMPTFDIRTAQIRLLELEAEHRELDQLIEALDQNVHQDDLALRRLKKRKLQLKDQIDHLVRQLAPGEPA